MPTENRSSNTEMVSVPEGYMLVERSIWTEQQVEAATACITRLKGVPGMRDCDLAMAAIDAAQCKAPDIVLADLLPAPQPHPEPIAWMVGTAIWWQKTGAERDSQDRGEPMVPLGPCDSPSEVARLTAQFKEWQASHHRNYCKTADERDELRSQLEQARRLLHTASIRLANWLEPGDDPRKQIIAFLEDTAEPVGTEDQPGFELIGPQLLEWNRSLVQPCILIGHEYGVATKAMKLARQALSGKS